MGFFDELKKSVNESYNNGKENYDLQQRWKREEAEYASNTKHKKINIENIVKGINIGNLAIEKKRIELQLKYGDNSSEDKKNLREMRRDVQSQINEIKISNPTNDSAEDEDLDFIDNYRSTRNKRVALCISYLQHPKATTIGKKDALSLILMSPYCDNMIDIQNDKPTLKKRLNIYNTQLNNYMQLSALDYCFYSHLISDFEVIPVNVNDKDPLLFQALGDRIGHENAMIYNDRDYGTHFQNLDFYRLSSNYTEQVAKQEEEILLSYYNEIK